MLPALESCEFHFHTDYVPKRRVLYSIEQGVGKQKKCMWDCKITKIFVFWRYWYAPKLQNWEMLTSRATTLRTLGDNPDFDTLKPDDNIPVLSDDLFFLDDLLVRVLRLSFLIICWWPSMPVLDHLRIPNTRFVELSFAVTALLMTINAETMARTTNRIILIVGSLFG